MNKSSVNKSSVKKQQKSLNNSKIGGNSSIISSQNKEMIKNLK